MGILKSEMHQLLNGKDLEEESYSDLITTNGSEKASVLTDLWQKKHKGSFAKHAVLGKDTRFKE